MSPTLGQWARGRRSRAALLTRRMLGTADPGDEALQALLAAELRAEPEPPHLAARAWRLIEQMDLGPAPAELVSALLAALESDVPVPMPLTLPTGVQIDDQASAQIAAEALALRALTKARQQDVPAVRARLDALARRGPDLEGVTRRVSALHGLAADAVHYPHPTARLVDDLLRAQRPDGGWGEGGLFHVVQALLSVEHEGADTALRRALPKLREAEEGDGGYGSDERGWIACRWMRRVGGL